jgi:hypothetical protein
LEIAESPVRPGDMAAVQRNRLMVDTIKWLVSKIAPRLYGDRVTHDHRVMTGVVVLPPLEPMSANSRALTASDRSSSDKNSEMAPGQTPGVRLLRESSE